MVNVRATWPLLASRHYLGPVRRGIGWLDEDGALVFAKPSGNGSWRNGKAESVKDRWVFVLRSDHRRADLLRVRDDAAARKAGRSGAWSEG